MGVLVMEDTENVKLLNAFFACLYCWVQPSWDPDLRGKRGSLEKGRLPLGCQGWVRDQLGTINLGDLIGCTHECWELSDIVALLLPIISEKSWTGEREKGTSAWWFKEGKCHSCLQKWQGDLENYQPASLTSTPGKVMEHIILEIIKKCKTRRFSGVQE